MVRHFFVFFLFFPLIFSFQKGKTALINRYTSNSLDSNSNISSNPWNTKIKKIIIEGRPNLLEILDTGGNDQLFRSKLQEVIRKKN